MARGWRRGQLSIPGDVAPEIEALQRKRYLVPMGRSLSRIAPHTWRRPFFPNTETGHGVPHRATNHRRLAAACGMRGGDCACNYYLQPEVVFLGN